MPSFKLNDKEIPFEKGDTIIRAAHRSGIDVPHYCWHPGLSVAANCRMCLVEVLPPPGRPAILRDVLEWDVEKQAYVPPQKPELEPARPPSVPQKGPKGQPACQWPVTAGMEVRSATSPHVERARGAVQEMLLL